MDKQTIDKANKTVLRKLCRERGVSYRKHPKGYLSNDKMRELLRAKMKPAEYARERLSDTLVIKVIKKVTAPSVLDLLKLIPVGDTFSAKEIAKRTGSTESTVRTIIGNCNSSAPSNRRYHNLGLRFEMTRGVDTVRRVTQAKKSKRME